MTGAILNEKDDALASRRGSYLSHSRINRYLLCPEQYRLYYVENLRPKILSASLVFGQAMHQALARLFQSGDDPAKFFQELWSEISQLDLNYNQKESWERLRTAGQRLLEKFVREEVSKLGNIHGIERAFEITVTSLVLPVVGVIDLVADLDGRKTVVDFKTAGSSYEEHEVMLSDQLTAYQLAEPGAEQAALCVLLKTKEPRIEWHVASRTGDQLLEYLAKVEYIAHEIAAGRFYKRPGKWCSWCDYLPVCTGDSDKVKQTLVQVR